MSLNRRLVLKGMALSGMAGFAMGSSTRALAGAAARATHADASPLLALVNDDKAGSAFVRGAIAANGSQLQQRTINSDLSVILALERQLRSREALRIIGLLDDASGTLVVDLARSAGARMLWLGQHMAHAGVTRHHVLNAGRAEDCVRRLADYLRDCGAGFQILAQQQGNIAQRECRARPRAGASMNEWPSAVGYLLASLITAPTLANPPPSGDVQTDGKFVSFSIEA